MTVHEAQRAFTARQKRSRENLRLVAPKAAEILSMSARLHGNDVERIAIVTAATQIWNLAQAALPGSSLDGETV